jgi:hypothetical protein
MRYLDGIGSGHFNTLRTCFSRDSFKFGADADSPEIIL